VSTGSYGMLYAGLTKLPRLLRLGRLTKKLDVFAAARALRILILLAGFVLLAHIMACFWFFLGVELLKVCQ
jgi:potassium voltage-gated channel Eag-related subfamily H protein 2